ncbi:MAG: Ig-like domain-containing protein, partial [Proteiniphilum sp.]|nr:Ig-like domain-containing protein [Proteiniphilum sp.]
MLNKILSFFSFLFLLLCAIVIIHSCANIASPTGGAYDVDPPVVRRATPGFNALNASPGRIEIEFDENIKIEKPNEKVIITPPQQNMPVIRSVGRKAIVELNDELLPNTTYTIDFTDAIVDNNEGNPIENFVYSFSTGDQLDTLSVSGKVVMAQDLEPVPGIYVGIHSNLDDTAFTKVPFQRISRTDSRGNFTVRGISPGEYKVYALNDLNRDYKYDNPQEAIAFLDSIIIPSAIRAERQDTVFVDSITIDTIRTVQYTRFLPDDLLLRTFLSDFQRQYLQKHERPEHNRLTLFFAAPTDRPTFSLLNPGVDGDDWYVAERSSKNDTLILWITDSLIYKQDSISMKINYIRTDSLNKDYIATDTLNFNIRKSTRGKRQESKGAEEEQALKFLGINSNVQSSFELYNPIRIEFAQPIVALDSSDVKL